jgi:hypothetical protein
MEAALCQGMEKKQEAKPEQPKALEIICAWCPTFDPKDPRNAQASHGMCPSCAAKF